MDAPSLDNVHRDKVTAWLRWLVGSSYQQNIRFLNNQNQLRLGLIKGELDWITCWSSHLKRLKLAMGDDLGLAALPRGPAQHRKASTRLEVWALGRNSSPRQRRKALVMLEFITKPWAQKTYALASSSAMPVSQKAAAIVASKIPGGSEALRNYASSAETPRCAEGTDPPLRHTRYDANPMPAGNHLRRAHRTGAADPPGSQDAPG